MSARVYNAPYQTIAPHDRTALQAANAYTVDSTTYTAPVVSPFDADGPTFARIEPVSGGGILVETAANGATPTACAIGSLRCASGAEYFIPLPPQAKLKIAGVSASITFNLCWVK